MEVFRTLGHPNLEVIVTETTKGDAYDRPKQIAELAAAVTAYDKWDKVVAALRP